MKYEIPPEIIDPCPKSWADMAGNEKSRFCECCQLHVHNLSAMNARERESLLCSSGRVCVAYEKDSAGFLVTRAAPFHGLLSRFGWAIAGLLASVVPLSLSSCMNRTTLGAMKNKQEQPTCTPSPSSDLNHGSKGSTQVIGKPLPPTPAPSPAKPFPKPDPRKPSPTVMLGGMIAPPLPAQLPNRRLATFSRKKAKTQSCAAGSY